MRSVPAIRLSSAQRCVTVSRWSSQPSHWTAAVWWLPFRPGPARTRTPSVVRNRQSIISFCCEGEGHAYICVSNFSRFSFPCLFSIFFPVTGRKSVIPRSPLPSHHCSRVPTVMPSPTTLTLKFVYPAAKYHQDIRTVTIYKYDSETEETSELYRVCALITARRSWLTGCSPTPV